MVANVLGDMGATIKFWVIMYKALVKAVLIYRSEIWVVTEAMMMVL